jgi:hypothetical protein
VLLQGCTDQTGVIIEFQIAALRRLGHHDEILADRRLGAGGELADIGAHGGGTATQHHGRRKSDDTGFHDRALKQKDQIT